VVTPVPSNALETCFLFRLGWLQGARGRAIGPSFRRRRTLCESGTNQRNDLG